MFTSLKKQFFYVYIFVDLAKRSALILAGEKQHYRHYPYLYHTLYFNYCRVLYSYYCYECINHSHSGPNCSAQAAVLGTCLKAYS